MSSPVVLDSIVDGIITAKCVVGCMSRYQAACVMQQAKQLFDQCKDRVALLDDQLHGEVNIRECTSCDWVGFHTECVHPKHVPESLLCPMCNDTTFQVPINCHDNTLDLPNTISTIHPSPDANQGDER